MTVLKAFTEWMENNGFGVRGTNLYVGAVPKKAPKASWWVVGGGGSPTLRSDTGEKMKAYVFSVFYRNIDAEDVDEKLQALEEKLNNKDCKELNGYETIDVEATGFASDNDLDGEDRVIGTVEATVTVYQSS